MHNSTMYHLEREELEELVKLARGWDLEGSSFNPRTKEGLIGLLVEYLEHSCGSLYSTKDSILYSPEYKERNQRRVAFCGAIIGYLVGSNPHFARLYKNDEVNGFLRGVGYLESSK